MGSKLSVFCCGKAVSLARVPSSWRKLWEISWSSSDPHASCFDENGRWTSNWFSFGSILSISHHAFSPLLMPRSGTLVPQSPHASPISSTFVPVIITSSASIVPCIASFFLHSCLGGCAADARFISLINLNFHVGFSSSTLTPHSPTLFQFRLAFPLT